MKKMIAIVLAAAACIQPEIPQPPTPLAEVVIVTAPLPTQVWLEPGQVFVEAGRQGDHLTITSRPRREGEPLQNHWVEFGGDAVLIVEQGRPGMVAKTGVFR